MINTVKSTHLWLVLVGFHDFQTLLSLFRPSRQSNIPTSVPRRAKKDSHIPSPGRTRSVKCPTSGPTKTIKSPPHKRECAKWLQSLSLWTEIPWRDHVKLCLVAALSLGTNCFSANISKRKLGALFLNNFFSYTLLKLTNFW